MIEKMFGLTSTSLESILSSLSKVSISKSFFYALSLFHSQSCPECIHTSEKWKGPKKSDLEIDTIDNDMKKTHLKLANMTKYPNIPYKFSSIWSFKNHVVPSLKKY